MSALVAPSGECLRGEGLVWLNGAAVCSRVQLLVSTCNGRPHLALQHAAAPIALAELPLR